MVSINEKSKLIKIIQKEHLTEEDKEELRQILRKLPSEELKSLLGKKYELFVKNYANLSDSSGSTTEIVNSENESGESLTSKQEKNEINIPNSTVFTIRSYNKNKPIWKFIKNFIIVNKDKIIESWNSSTEDQFFSALNNSILEQLKEKKLLIYLPSNTIKAIPNEIKIIFLMLCRLQLNLTTDEILESVEVKGQEGKARIMANHLSIDLPLSMTEKLLQILESKKELIETGDFEPNTRNIIYIDNTLKPLLIKNKLSTKIQRWLEKNTQFKNLTELKDHFRPDRNRYKAYKSIKPSKDTKRAKVKIDVLKRIVDTIIKNNPSINFIKDLSIVLYKNPTTLSGALYGGRTMDYKIFKKFETLYGSPIPHEVQSKVYTRGYQWKFLYEDEKGVIINDDEARKRAATYLKNDVLKGDFSKYDQDYIIRVLKRSDFISAIKNRGFDFNEILIEANLSLNLETFKWEKFMWDESGIPRTKEQALQNAGDFLVSLIEDNDYDFGYLGAPNIEFLQSKHADFIGAVSNHNLLYNEILRIKGLKLNRENERWSFLDIDDFENKLNLNKVLERVSNYFNMYIFTPAFKETYNINLNEAPKIELVKNWIKGTEHGGFLRAISLRNIKYNDILRFLNLQVNYDPNLWNWLDWSPDGFPQTYQHALAKAGAYLKNEVLTDEFKKEYNLDQNEAPAFYILKDHVIHSSFSFALNNKKISFKDVLWTLGYIPQDNELLKDIGKNFHWIGEKIFIQFTRSKGCLSYYEIRVNIKTKDPLLYKLFGKNKSDNSIIVNNYLHSLSVHTRNIPSHIKIIHVDYFLGSSKRKIKGKCRKGYQGKDRTLILVPLHAKSEMSVPNLIPFKKNVLILSPEKLVEFFGFDTFTKDLFLKYVNIAKEAIFREQSYQLLLNKKLTSKNYLLNNGEFSQMGLENYLDRNYELLKYSPDKNHIYYFEK